MFNLTVVTSAEVVVGDDDVDILAIADFLHKFLNDEVELFVSCKILDFTYSSTLVHIRLI